MFKQTNLESTALTPSEVQQTIKRLNYLHQHESLKAFHRDLAHANAELHRHGFPNVEVVSTHHGLKLRAERAPQQGRADGIPDGGQNGHDNGPPSYQRGSNGRSGINKADEQRFVSPAPTIGGDRQTHPRPGLDYAAKHSTPELARESAKIVAQVAQQMGIDPVIAVATMLVESRGNPRAIGDHKASVGLFQLNKHGEGHGLTYEQKIDPYFNTRVALSEFQRRQGEYKNPGDWAAASQRPKHRHSYSKAVNRMLPYAQDLVES